VFLFPLQSFSETFLILRSIERDMIKSVFLFPLQSFSETFLILRSIERDMIKKSMLVFM